MENISFVLPVYNEEENIDTLFNELKNKVISKIKQKKVTLIFVNDGSTDKSLEKIYALDKNVCDIEIVNLSRNYGHQAAITAGLSVVKSDAVIIMDTDLQDPPEIALELIEEAEKGFDVVYAKRLDRDDPWLKKVTSAVFYRFLNSVTNLKIPNDTGEFRLITAPVLKAFLQMPEYHRYIRGMMTYVGFKQKAVNFIRLPRTNGQSAYTWKRMFRLAGDALTSYSDFPTKVIYFLASTYGVLSILGIIYTLFIKIKYTDLAVPGWAFIVISVLITGFCLMLVLGLLSSYIVRIFHESLKRPLYIISKHEKL